MRTVGPPPLFETVTSALDDLSREAFDALPFGAIQVDGRGVIHRYNMTESRISGRLPERVIGRNFFIDVAPCTNIPAFAGRFHDGVAAGSLDAHFEFVFDFHMAPTRVAIHMRNAGEPDRYWILVEKLADLVPNRPETAVALVAARTGVAVTGAVVDFSVCEREVLEAVGSVQPWGCLLAARPEDGTIVAASANAAAMLGPAARVGGSLADLLDAAQQASLAAWCEQAGPSAPDAWRAEIRRAAQAFDARAHRGGDHLILECEPLAGRDAARLQALTQRAEEAVAAFRTTRTLAELAQAAAIAVRAVTGFERVLIYRFDADWHGEVIGEDKVPDWEQSFAGLHFPASDIPRQARDLYTRCLQRHVPDRDYVPVPIEGRVSGRQLDLSLARYRSVSPVHLEYQRNMGVNGSMSLSIMVEDRLWGLVACHHRRPHFVPVAQRSLAMTLTEALALRVAAVTRAEANQGRQRDSAVLSQLIGRMAAADAIEPALLQGTPSILDLWQSSGVALFHGGDLHTLGTPLPKAFLHQLRAWLDDHWDAQGLYATDCLSAVLPEAFPHRDTASGVFAARLGETDCLVWLRPEQSRILTWGGDPAKAINAEAGRPLPRVSFERWVEERRGHAVPWPEWTPEIALSLRHAISDVMLRHLRQVRELNEQLAESNAAKARFLANMSHELRTPLNAILGFSDLMLSGAVGQPAPRHAGYLRDIHASGEHLLAMVNDILDLSRIEAGRLTLSLTPVDLATLMAESLVMVQQRATTKGIRLEAQVENGPLVLLDETRIRQILLNLLSNAVKFTPADGIVTVAVAYGSQMTTLTVTDTGPGMTPEEIESALQPFRHANDLTRHPEEGAGLGLPISKSLAELHGGTLTITTAPGGGTSVCVCLPNQRSIGSGIEN